MLKKLKNLWCKKKVQYFVFTHLLLLIGISTVPINIWYFYDLLILIWVTWPINSVIQHLYFTHGYYKFRFKFVKYVILWYLAMINFWKFSDSKSYHITHHKEWLTDSDPTAGEVRQGYWKYYFGLTEPYNIPTLYSDRDAEIDFVNKYYFPIKFISLSIFILLFGWYLFVHLIIVQIFLGYLTQKAIEIIFHRKDSAKDLPWLFWLYGNDAWHVEHHKTYDKNIWHWKPINLQYMYSKLLFSNIK